MLTREELLLIALENIVNDYDDTGCQDCGTVSVGVINKARELLGLAPLEAIEDEYEFGSYADDGEDE